MLEIKKLTTETAVVKAELSKVLLIFLIKILFPNYLSYQQLKNVYMFNDMPQHIIPLKCLIAENLLLLKVLLYVLNN